MDWISKQVEWIGWADDSVVLDLDINRNLVITDSVLFFEEHQIWIANRRVQRNCPGFVENFGYEPDGVGTFLAMT